jgi:hypothetical protein
VNYSNKVNLTWVEDGQNEKCIQNVSQKTWKEERNWGTYVWIRELLTWVLKKQGMRVWTRFNCQGSWEQNNKPYGSIKGKEIILQLSDNQLVIKGSTQ